MRLDKISEINHMVSFYTSEDFLVAVDPELGMKRVATAVTSAEVAAKTVGGGEVAAKTADEDGVAEERIETVPGLSAELWKAPGRPLPLGKVNVRNEGTDISLSHSVTSVIRDMFPKKRFV